MEQSSSTMQLTRAADYGVRVMIHLATLPGNQRTRLPMLARATGAPESFLSKVLQALCRAGFIASQRGQMGGFEILPAGRQASISAVIEAVDGPICLNRCVIQEADCKRISFCPAHPVWARAQQAVMAVLNEASIAELALAAATPAVAPCAACAETA
ncbi:MAG: Rrf2 family transcriptional regulator [Terracidiphilus sp.]